MRRIRQRLRWFFELWPKGWKFWFLALVGVSVSALLQYFFWDVSQDSAHVTLVFPVVFVILISGYYGCYRVLRFHPAANKRYREWLLHTPYEWTKQLPTGSVLICGRDIPFIGVLSLLLLRVGWVPLHAGLASFLFGYLAASAYILFRLQLRRPAWSLAMALAITIGVLSNPTLALCILACSYALAIPAIQGSLSPGTLSRVSIKADYAFLRLRMFGMISESAKKAFQARARRDLAQAIEPDNRAAMLSPYEYSAVVGWPLAIMGPVSIDDSFQSPRYAMAVGGLCAAWVVAFLVHIPEAWLAFAGVFTPENAVFFAGLVLALRRLTLYLACSWPNVSIFSRILSASPIRWRFDRVFGVPCLVALAGVYGPRLLESIGFSVAWACALSIFACVSITIAGPPTLRNWILTGHHRLTGALGMSGYVWRV